MGSSTGKPPLPSTLTSAFDARYGGRIFLDSNQTHAYQILQVDENSIQNFSHLMNERKELRHFALINVNRAWVEEYRENCSLQKMYRVTVEYLYIPTCLQDQISKYCDFKRPVPEILLRKYFSDVVTCLQYLRSKGTCHGDIKAKTILISSNGRAFISDSFFINGGKISFEIVMDDPQSLSLLSPTQLDNLRNNKFVSLQNVHADEIFSVGLTMMEAMTAQPAMECYDLLIMKIKSDYFGRKYHEMVSNGYSVQVSQLVMRCLEMEPEKRVSFTEYLQVINTIYNNRLYV